MSDSGSQANPRNHGGWRRLGAFWAAIVLLLAIGAGTLQLLGPPAGTSLEASAGKASAQTNGDARAALLPGAGNPSLPVAPVLAGRDTPGPVADPEPALLQPLTEGSKLHLPRIAADGRTAMQAYAAGFDRGSRRPRIGVLLGGIGMNEADSVAAIRTLPGAVSLAVSPYAANGASMLKLLAAARATGHEYLIAIPLEPNGFPLNDPGPSTLLTSLPAAMNLRNLAWAMSRIDGYVGAAGVVGTMRGERLAAMTDQMEAVLAELAARGLLYVDPREGNGAVAKTWGRHVDLVIDDPADQGAADRTMIDAKFAALEQLAKDNGSALGLVMRPTPVAVARIAAWSNGLADRGLALAPVSALVVPPKDVPVKLSERGR